VTVNDRKSVVLIALQQALLGEVGPTIRLVTVNFDETSVHFDVYYDGEITAEDRESMSQVETELLALFPETHSTTHQLHRIDFPGILPKNSTWAYFRKESQG
jgi:hypothetical protein